MIAALAHTNDPETSHESAASLNLKKNAQLKEVILDLLRRRPRAQFQLTKFYVKFKRANDWPDVKDDSVAKRLSELVQAGLVVDSGMKVESPYGKNVVVWAVPS